MLSIIVFGDVNVHLHEKLINNLWAFCNVLVFLQSLEPCQAAGCTVDASAIQIFKAVDITAALSLRFIRSEVCATYGLADWNE